MNCKDSWTILEFIIFQKRVKITFLIYRGQLVRCQQVEHLIVQLTSSICHFLRFLLAGNSLVTLWMLGNCQYAERRVLEQVPTISARRMAYGNNLHSLLCTVKCVSDAPFGGGIKRLEIRRKDTWIYQECISIISYSRTN